MDYKNADAKSIRENLKSNIHNLLAEGTVKKEIENKNKTLNEMDEKTGGGHPFVSALSNCKNALLQVYGSQEFKAPQQYALNDTGYGLDAYQSFYDDYQDLAKRIYLFCQKINDLEKKGNALEWSGSNPINESQLDRIIAESVRRVLNESAPDFD